ncbi:GyrI-like domain-containing protein [Devosia sp.]|uniref:GyrI-like domain-containing protein n=1 Tax=Devosia sp. TaxID=1871048 RepID=UPI003266CB8B
MLTEPTVVTKAAQPYAAMILTLSQPEIAQTAPPLIGKVIEWVKGQGGELAGPPYFNYFNFLPGGKMQMQVGMPTATVMQGDDMVTTGLLPAGRYAAITHTGPYHELYEANMALDKWARGQGFAFAGTELPDRYEDATRLEIYHKDPGEDPSGFPVTEVAFRLKD